MDTDTTAAMSASEDISDDASRGWFANQPYVLLSIAAACWAGNAIVGRLAAGHIPPVTLAFLRWANRFSDHPSHGVETSQAGLARDPRQTRLDDLSVRDRHRRFQHDAILGAGIYPGIEHAASAINRTAVRRMLVAGSVRDSADAGAGHRNCGLADGRAGDPAAWRHHRDRGDRLQPRGHHFPGRAFDLRTLHGGVAEAARHSRPFLHRLYIRLRLGGSLSPADLRDCSGAR